jgi:hypothetical protein
MNARLGAACGWVGVAGNVLGVVALGPIPSAYRPGALEAWAGQTLAAPGPASASAVAFTLGLVGLAGWALALRAWLESPAADAAWLVAAGALLNAAGTLTPLVVALHLSPLCAAGHDCLPAATGLLGLSLALDALFNFLLGIGLVAIGLVLRNREPRRRGLATLAVIAGVASIPVSLQVEYTAAARWLAVAGPLWLAFTAWTSVLLWRGRP